MSPALRSVSGGSEGLFAAIEGEDPRETVGLWIRLNDWVHKGGNEGEASASLSTIDVALWDMKAKLADEPLWRTLGAREGRVRAYASGLDYCLSDEELYAFYRRMAEQGIDTGKLKVGLDPMPICDGSASCARRCGRLAAAGTHDRLQRILVAQAGGALHPPARGEVRPGVGRGAGAALGLRWAAARVAAGAGGSRDGENIQRLADVYPLIANQAVDVLNVSAVHSGVTGCRQIARMAQTFGCRCR